MTTIEKLNCSGCGQFSGILAPLELLRQATAVGHGATKVVLANLPKDWVLTTFGRVYCPECWDKCKRRYRSDHE